MGRWPHPFTADDDGNHLPIHNAQSLSTLDDAGSAAIVTGLAVHDVRFPTSRDRDGSDAMNPLPDYSAAYVTLEASSGEQGTSLVFTIGRGTEVQLAAVTALEPLVLGLPLDEMLDDLGAFSHLLVSDSPTRWLGPEKGIAHMAVGAVVNAAWDLKARRAGKPLWKLLADLTAGGARRPRRLPLHRRRPHARRCARTAARGRAGARRARGPPALRGISRLYDDAGLARATTTRSSCASASRPCPTASRRSS